MKKLIAILITVISLDIFMYFSSSNNEENYEITSFTYNAIEEKDTLQFYLSVEISNPTSKTVFVSMNYPSYIIANLSRTPAPVQLSPNSSASFSTVISVNKNGAEMTEDTKQALLNKELPIINNFIIGEAVHIHRENR